MMDTGGESADVVKSKLRSTLSSRLSESEWKIIDQLVDSLWVKNDRPANELMGDLVGAGLSEERARPLLWLLIEKQLVGLNEERNISVDKGWPRDPDPAEDLIRDERLFGQPKKKNDERSDSERDRDRILFSSAFRRLAGVTQVVAPTETHPIHNRLTHSLKVAQIGRGLAMRLLYPDGPTMQKRDFAAFGGLDPYIVEAAGLAHDLGHPPFGHVAEQELNALVSYGLSVSIAKRPSVSATSDADRGEMSVPVRGMRDGFEGNAQSFRIVTKLATRFHDIPGLDLTRATLRAMLKYPWLRDTRGIAIHSKRFRKWGAYTSEKAEFDYARRHIEDEYQDVRSLEAELMDWADDIAYAVHDLEDFYRAGLIPLDRLALSDMERESFVESELSRQERANVAPSSTRDQLLSLLERLLRIAPFEGPYIGTRSQRASVRQFTSTLISQYMGAMTFENRGWGAQCVEVKPWARREVETLKGLTWHYVIDSQSLASQRFGQRRVIRTLVEIYANAAVSDDRRAWRMFPEFFQNEIEIAGSNDSLKLRTVADVIASLSEVQAIETYQRLTGQTLGSALAKQPG